jgi:hypothetical protein
MPIGDIELTIFFSLRVGPRGRKANLIKIVFWDGTGLWTVPPIPK